MEEKKQNNKNYKLQLNNDYEDKYEENYKDSFNEDGTKNKDNMKGDNQLNNNDDYNHHRTLNYMINHRNRQTINKSKNDIIGSSTVNNNLSNTLAIQEDKLSEHRSNYRINKIDDNLKKRLFYISEETSYPPYDIEKLESNNHDFELYRVIIAVAGFKKEDLQIVLNEDCLVIKGAARSSDRVLLHKGISSKSFEKIFQLADSMSIRHSFLRDGLLCIDIIRHIMRKNVQNIEIITGSDVLMEI